MHLQDFQNAITASLCVLLCGSASLLSPWYTCLVLILVNTWAGYFDYTDKKLCLGVFVAALAVVFVDAALVLHIWSVVLLFLTDVVKKSSQKKNKVQSPCPDVTCLTECFQPSL